MAVKYDVILGKLREEDGGTPGGTPGGSDTQLQYNNSGAFAGARFDYSEPVSTTAQLTGSAVATGAAGTKIKFKGGTGGAPSGAVINPIVVNTPGTGYTVADVLTVVGGANDATFTVATVDGGGGILTGTTTTLGTGYPVGSSVLNFAGGTGTGATAFVQVVIGGAGGDIILEAGVAGDGNADGSVRLLQVTDHTYTHTVGELDDNATIHGFSSANNVTVQSPYRSRASGHDTTLNLTGNGELARSQGQYVKVYNSNSNSSSNISGARYEIQNNASAATNSLNGTQSSVETNHSTGTLAEITGTKNTIFVNSGTVASVKSDDAIALNYGTISSSLYGKAFSLINGSGTIPEVRLVTMDVSNSGTITTLTGYYLGTIVGGTNTNKPYNIWLTDADARNVMNGKTGLGVNDPTARLHLQASDGTAGTAPIKLTSGTVLATPEAGTIEFDGANIYLTV